MSALLRAELLKARTTRTTALLLAWMLGVGVLVALLHVLSFGVDDLSRRDNQLRIAGLGTTLAALFGALVGALSMTSEFRHGTIRPTLMVSPDRQRLVAAKVLAALGIGAAFGLLAAVLIDGVEAAGLAARGVHIDLSASTYVQLVVGAVVSGALFAAIGVGVGALVRNQVAAVAGVAIWLLFLEPLLLSDLPDIGRYAPEASGGAIAGAIQTQITDDLVAPLVGALLLCVYALGAAVAGAAALAHTDID